MKKHILLIMICILMFSTFSFAFEDQVNLEITQNSFLITEDTINVQQGETTLERQLLSKEASYTLKKEIKQTYINEMWATYSSTIVLVADIIIMIFSLFILRLFVFLVVEALPYGVNKMVDYIEDWFK